MPAQDLIDACLCKLDDLEAIIWYLSDDANLHTLRNSLTTLVDVFTAILDDESNHCKG